MAGRRTVVALGMPTTATVPVGFLRAVTMAMCDPDIEFRPLIIGNTVVHLARDMMMKAVLADPSIDFLVMVDSDQVWHPSTIRRLVGWNKPVVAPVVVQRNGEAIPVVYREVVQDASGFWRYEPLLQEVAAYLRRFDPARWQANAAGVGLLPLEPDYPHPNITGIPDEIARGLDDPLLPIDATGTGMVCIRRDVLEALTPDPKSGLLCDFQQGGEDFSIMRAVRAAGWWGMTPPATPEGKGHGIYVDRGIVVGHLLQYSRGAGDLLDYFERFALEAAADDAAAGLADMPPATDLVRELREREVEGAAV